MRSPRWIHATPAAALLAAGLMISGCSTTGTVGGHPGDDDTSGDDDAPPKPDAAVHPGDPDAAVNPGDPDAAPRPDAEPGAPDADIPDYDAGTTHTGGLG